MRGGHLGGKAALGDRHPASVECCTAYCGGAFSFSFFFFFFFFARAHARKVRVAGVHYKKKKKGGVAVGRDSNYNMIPSPGAKTPWVPTSG